MEQWEYKVVKVKTRGMMGGILETDEFETVLNGMGTKGWELVSTLATSQGYGQSREVAAVFKRRIG